MRTRSLRKASILLAVSIIVIHQEGLSRSLETKTYITCSSQSNSAEQCLKCAEKKALHSSENSKVETLKKAFSIRQEHLRQLFQGFWAINCAQPMNFDEALSGHIYNACAYTSYNAEWEYWSCHENFCEEGSNDSSCSLLEELRAESREITDLCATKMKKSLNIKTLKLDYSRELAYCKAKQQ